MDGDGRPGGQRVLRVRSLRLFCRARQKDQRCFRRPAPWAGYVLALLVGTVAAGGSVLEVEAAAFGIPLAWVAGWMNARSERWGWSAVVALILLGLVVGFALR
ncbi:hypothetical protein GCM10009798_10670 [Nocardioides panacihumi]|uniref:Uncharacterized protein n=1 Tax=Nocardioides panacihumi TaxID=400774 RepID=A0ABN2QIZ7_9ACTN